MENLIEEITQATVVLGMDTYRPMPGNISLLEEIAQATAV